MTAATSPSESILGRFSRHTTWLTLARVGEVGLMFGQVLIAARLLPLAAFGTWVTVTTTGFVIYQIFAVRTGEVLLRFLPEYQAADDPQGAFRAVRWSYGLSLLGGVVAALLLLILAPPMATMLLKQPESEELFQVYALVALLSALQEPTLALLRLSHHYGSVALFSFSTALARFVLVTFAGWWFGSPLALIWGLVAATIITQLWIAYAATWQWHSFRRAASYGSDREEDRLGLDRRKWTFLAWNQLSFTIASAGASLDTILLAWIAGPAVVGPYDVARRIAKQSVVLTAPMVDALYPELTRLWVVQDLEGLQRLLRRISMLVFGVAVVVCSVAFLVAPWLVGLFGSRFDDSVRLLRILEWQWLMIPLFWGVPLLLITGRGRLAFLLGLADLGLLLLILPPFAHQWGPAGMAWGMLVRGGLWTALLLAASVGSLRKEPRARSGEPSAKC